MCKCAYTHTYLHMVCRLLVLFPWSTLTDAVLYAMPDRSTTARGICDTVYIFCHLLQTCPKPILGTSTPGRWVFCCSPALAGPGRALHALKEDFSPKRCLSQDAHPVGLFLLFLRGLSFLPVWGVPTGKEVIKHRAAPIKFHFASLADFLCRPAVIYQSVLSRKRGGNLRWEQGPWFAHLNSHLFYYLIALLCRPDPLRMPF